MSKNILKETSFDNGNGISETFNCFGCSPKNPGGLKLKFERCGDTILAPVKIGKVYESFPGVVHGGIVATILDEVMAQVAFCLDHLPSMTVGLRIRYLQPMEVDKKYTSEAKVISRVDQTVEVEGKLKSEGKDNYIAVAKGTFFIVSPDYLLSDKLRLPRETYQSFSNFITS